MRLKICYSLAGFALLAAAACGGDKGGSAVTAPPVVEADRLFNLQQVNGQTLPATFQPAEGTLVITAGKMELRVGKTFSESIIYTLTPAGGAAAADTAITTGTYAQTGSDIVFTVPPSGSDPAYTFGGTVSGNTLSYNDAGFVALYQR